MERQRPPQAPPPPVDPGWRRVRTCGIDVDLPADVVPTAEQGIDGGAFVAEGPGLRLTLDASPFRDRLTSRPPRAGSRRWTDTVTGHEVMAFDDDDGTVLAASLPGLLTVTVHVSTGTDTGPALRIIRSIRAHIPGDDDD